MAKELVAVGKWGFDPAQFGEKGRDENNRKLRALSKECKAQTGTGGSNPLCSSNESRRTDAIGAHEETQ